MRRGLLLSLIVVSQITLGQDYTISKWLNNKKSATVLTYDDWSPGHGPIGVPNLVSRDLVGTFFITTGNAWLGYSVPQNNVANGIEFANHTNTHPNLANLTPTELEDEIGGAKTILDNNIPGQTVWTLAYPLGSYNQGVIDETRKEHIAARTVQLPNNGLFEYEFASNEQDYYLIRTATVNSSLSVSNFNNYISNGVNNGGMVVFMLHSIYNSSYPDSWYDAIHEDLYNEFLDQLTTRLDETWNATFLDAVRYHKEWHCATLNTVSKSTTAWKLNLTDTLSNDAIYEQPLTIWLKLEEEDTVTAVLQDGDSLAYEYSASGDSIYFNAVPDGGEIHLSGNLVAGISEDYAQTTSVYPNPTTGHVFIKSSFKEGQVVVFNMLGQALRSFDISDYQTEHDFSSLKDGTYILQFKTPEGTFVKRIVKQ